MRGMSRSVNCVFAAMCLKTITLVYTDKVSLTLKRNNFQINYTDTNISSMGICESYHHSNSTSSNGNFIVNCSESRNRTNPSVKCTPTIRFENCSTTSHLVHKHCERALVVFHSLQIEFLKSNILNYSSCSVIGDGSVTTTHLEVIVIATSCSVTLFVIIILIVIGLVKNCFKIKPSPRAAQIKPVNDCTQIESKPLDRTSFNEIRTNDKTIISLLPKISEINENLQSSKTLPIKNPGNVSSLYNSKNAQVSMIQANNLVDIRPCLSIEPHVVASSKELDIEILDECNVYSLIETEGGDDIKASAREPLSLPQPRRKTDVDTADGTTRKEVNDLRDVYFMLDEETPEDMNSKMRESYDERTQCNLAGNEGNKFPKFCVAEVNDVYSRLGQEVKEFDNTYNITPNEEASSCDQ